MRFERFPPRRAAGCGSTERRDPETPVVVFTVAGDEDTAVQALQAGAQDYLVKAELTPPLLRRSIRYAIERTRMEAKKRRLLSLLLEAARMAS